MRRAVLVDTRLWCVDLNRMANASARKPRGSQTQTIKIRVPHRLGRAPAACLREPLLLWIETAGLGYDLGLTET